MLGAAGGFVGIGDTGAASGIAGAWDAGVAGADIVLAATPAGIGAVDDDGMMVPPRGRYNTVDESPEVPMADETAGAAVLNNIEVSGPGPGDITAMLEAGADNTRRELEGMVKLLRELE